MEVDAKIISDQIFCQPQYALSKEEKEALKRQPQEKKVWLNWDPTISANEVNNQGEPSTFPNLPNGQKMKFEPMQEPPTVVDAATLQQMVNARIELLRKKKYAKFMEEADEVARQIDMIERGEKPIEPVEKEAEEEGPPELAKERLLIEIPDQTVLQMPPTQYPTKALDSKVMKEGPQVEQVKQQQAQNAERPQSVTRTT